jgi:hypothetical protein
VEQAGSVAAENKMAKKSKERSEVEHLRATVKSQRSLIKHLKKEIGRAQKRQHVYEDLEDKVAELHLEDEIEESQLVSDDKCPECDKGRLEIIDLGPRKMLVCDNCKYRKVKK